MIDRGVESLQRGIEVRQDELSGVTELLARQGSDLQRTARLLKLATIVLGGLVAFRDVLTSSLGPVGGPAKLFFASLGALIALLAAVDAAFKYEARGSELRFLSNECQTTRRQVDTEWRTEVDTAADITERLTAAKVLIKLQDERLANVKGRATALSLPIVFDVIQQWKAGRQRLLVLPTT